MSKKEITWKMLQEAMKELGKPQVTRQVQLIPIDCIRRIKDKIGNWESLRIMYPYHAAAIDRGEL